MALKGVRIKRSSVKDKKPAPTTDLEYGDLALNFHHESGALFVRAEDDSLLEWPAGGAATATTTVKGVVQLADAAAITAGTAGRVVDAAQLKAHTVSDATATVKGVVQLADGAAITAGTAGRVVDAAQLKAAAAIDATTTTKGVVQLADAAAITAGTAGRVVDAAQLKAAAATDATDAVKGVVELATAAETTAGTDATRAVTPAGLKVELDKKADLAGPALTGVPTAPTATPGTNTTQLATTAFVAAAAPGDASTTTKGLVQLADGAAITAGTAGRVVDAAQLKAAAAVDATTAAKGLVQLADTTAVTNGTAGRVVDAAQLKAVKDSIGTGGGPTIQGGFPIYTLGTGTPSNPLTISLNAATGTQPGSMSAADKGKLDGISAGAEVNVQSDWNETDNTSDAFIKNKPTISATSAATTSAAGIVQLADQAATTAGTAGRVLDAAMFKANLFPTTSTTGWCYPVTPANTATLNLGGVSRVTIDDIGRAAFSDAPLQQIGGQWPALLVQGGTTAGRNANLTVFHVNSGSVGPKIILGKLKSSTLAGNSPVAMNDSLGQFRFCCSNGVDMSTYAALYDVLVDEAPPGGSYITARHCFGMLTSTGYVEKFRVCRHGIMEVKSGHVTHSTTGNLSAADLLNGIIVSAPAAAITLTLPAGSALENEYFGHAGSPIGTTFNWSIINNNATNAITIHGSTGHTILPATLSIKGHESARFMTMKNAANQYVTYRIG